MIKLVIFVAMMILIALMVIIVMYRKRKNLSVIILGGFNLILLYIGSYFVYQYIYQNNVLHPYCDIDPLCMNENGMLMMFGLFFYGLLLIGMITMAILVTSINQKQHKIR
mgnify:CR=1 FL=1